MDGREQRGLEIAALVKLAHKGKVWMVPSQSGNGTYEVNMAEGTCTCPDHETRGVLCKHIFAVQYTIKRETHPDESVTDTLRQTVTETKEVQVTYGQDWTAYNKAQTSEKARFMALLADLCQSVPQPIQTNGRPRLPMADMVFATAYKVYTGFSSRRFTTDVRAAQATGLVATTPHFNSVSSYLSNSELTPILKSLITASSLPLKVVETEFAIDSSGFSTSRFIRWFSKKYGREIDNREWVKAHLVCGVKTHIVTAVEMTGWSASDTNYFKPLLEQTA